jgi:uncharacterized protein (TIGR00369 family)
MTLDRIAPGQATMSMTITEAMSNGQGNCHGGYMFTLADSPSRSPATATTSWPWRSIARSPTCKPGRIGDRLTATAVEVSRKGRSGIYDIRLTNQNGEHIASSAAIRAPSRARTCQSTHEADRISPGGSHGIDLTPRKADLDPIEIASRDEISALATQAHEAVAEARL